MAPERSDLVLSADVPDIELHILVCDRLDVESDGWDRGDSLVQLQLVEYCCDGCQLNPWFREGGQRLGRTCLSGSVETQHQQSHLLRPKQLGLEAYTSIRQQSCGNWLMCDFEGTIPTPWIRKLR